jgi:type IV pilus assembly protein PilM
MLTDNILIGLDIGSSSIKMVETKHTKNGPILQTFGLAQHNINLQGYWDSVKLRQLSIIIEELMATNSFTGVRTVLSVMSQHVYVTTMDFDIKWDKNKIQAEIERQAPYFLPYPADEMRLSWRPIPLDDEIQEYLGKQRVSIKAIPDFIFENSKNLLEHVNLDGIVLEIQTESQIRSILPEDLGKTVLVDIGSTQSTFSIIIDGVLRSSSHIPIGVGQINKDLSEALGIDEITAENFKRDLHLINLLQLPKPVNDFFKILKTEVNSFIEINKKIGQNPDRVVFTGGGVMTAGLFEYFDNYHTTCMLGDSLKRVVVPEEFKAIITPISNQFSTAIGMSLWS